MPKINFTKIDIIDNLNKKTGFSRLFSKKLINNFLGILLLNIKKNNLNLKNIGTFKLIFKKEREGRNPKTKKIFKISSRKSISFKASKRLIKVLNSNK